MSQKYVPLDTFSMDFEKADIEIFDPPLCCPTGLCGPSLDQTLLDVSEMIQRFQSEGYSIKRYQMTSHPQAFISNPEVMRLVREKQMDALPITMVHGKVIKIAGYATQGEIQAKLEGERS
jgi:hypothetical protein